METIIDSDGSRVCVIRGFLSPTEAQRAFDVLATTLPWTQEHARIFGRSRPLPRLTAWVGDVAYRYSGVEHAPAVMSESLNRLAARVAEVVPRPNGMLGNLYRTGQDSVGWHADDEAIFGPNPSVASISLGAARDFMLRHEQTKEVTTVVLTSGSLLVMEGTTQTRYRHCVPKRARVSTPRINLTFRRIV